MSFPLFIVLLTRSIQLNSRTIRFERNAQLSQDVYLSSAGLDNGNLYNVRLNLTRTPRRKLAELFARVSVPRGAEMQSKTFIN